ncbi:hypothetical protein SK803_29810 [Lentzea sp. BCCO 10_0856]|uniref:Uncharacterized protein n=1 Tax=Lentzea miocenica TaxID=3095431 RepID=A0ABU4T8P7_9PSEU|nr:hypothetical protein [Lentzea sp. BCCO 10_0856]MDX8034434.1 hypothetical protein [Lentzea sp. BCCO 10_0856]
MGDGGYPQGCLQRDHRTRADAEQPLGAGGSCHGTDVLDLGAETVPGSERAALAAAPAVDDVDGEVGRQRVGEALDVGGGLHRAGDDEKTRAAAGGAVVDGGAIG